MTPHPAHNRHQMEYALITGASKGIGKAIAADLAARGFNVLLVARSEELLQQEAARLTTLYPIKADWLALDLSAADSAQNVYDWCRAKGYTVQALVNNAGYGLSGPFEKYSLQEFTPDILYINGLINRTDLVKILGNGEMKSKVAFRVNAASAKAKDAITAAGGTIEIL